MPREITTCQANSDFVTEVLWRAGADDGSGFVQIGVVNRGAATPAAAAKPPAETTGTPDGDADPDGTPASSLYASLSREGINRVIRTLRRARDQAYGVDA